MGSDERLLLECMAAMLAGVVVGGILFALHAWQPWTLPQPHWTNPLPGPEGFFAETALPLLIGLFIYLHVVLWRARS